MSALPKLLLTPEETTTRNRRQGRNNKKKGTRNEHKSMQRHTDGGAYCIRAGGSLGIFDFLALYPSYCLFVQVKSNRWPSPAEMATVHAFECPPYGSKIIERWDDYARSPLVREVS